MKLLVGLGNPGNKYQETRHNIGFRFLDTLAKREGLTFSINSRFKSEIATWNHSSERILLIKPQTFMNNSGESVTLLMQYYDIPSSEIIVIYDDLDLPVNKVRIKVGGGHGGHNGLRSLHQHMPDSHYTRIKIGIGRPEHGEISPWVLGKTNTEDRISENNIFHALLSELPTILAGNTDTAANKIHLMLNQGA